MHLETKLNVQEKSNQSSIQTECNTLERIKLNERVKMDVKNKDDYSGVCLKRTWYKADICFRRTRSLGTERFTVKFS